MKVKPVIMWALTLNGELCNGTEFTRSQLIRGLEKSLDWKWRQCKSAGYEAIRVRVVPLDK